MVISGAADIFAYRTRVCASAVHMPPYFLFFFAPECTCDKSDNDHGNGLDYLYLSHINMLAHVRAGTHLYTKKKYTKYNLFICACPSSRFDHVILHTKNRTSTEFIKFTISSSFSFFGARMEPGNLCQKRQ